MTDGAVIITGRTVCYTTESKSCRLTCVWVGIKKSERVFEIGKTALRIIGTSFIPATFSLMLPIFFQAIGRGAPSVVLTLLRQIFCLISLFYAFSFIGLDYTWIAFPLSETITTVVGFILYYRQIHIWKVDYGYSPKRI